MQPISAYLKFLKSLLEKLDGMDQPACATKLPDAFLTLSDYLLPQEKNDELAVAAANTMCDIIDVCIKEPLMQVLSFTCVAGTKGQILTPQRAPHAACA
jgi:hypothetical protein